MLDLASEGHFKALYCVGEDIVQSDPNTQHVTHALENMECVIVQDLFLNETAMYAHVFFPGASFLEKSGTFTNAERRISPVRRVMAPKNNVGGQGYEDWEITAMLAQALGYKMDYQHASDIMDEIAAMEGMTSVSIQLAPSSQIVSTYSPIHKAQGFRFYPDKIKGEGFFIAVFQKQKAAYTSLFSTPFQFTLLPKKVLANLTAMYAFPEQFICIQHQEDLIAIVCLSYPNFYFHLQDKTCQENKV